MAPTFRSSRSGRQFAENAARNRAADHDVFEGLPIRRWTRQNHTVSQDSQIHIPSNAGREPQGDYPFPELPMPKDSHLLAPQSRALLRAARAGYIYLRAPSKDSSAIDEKEPTEADETVNVTKMERSYTARKWSQLPKHVEIPEVEFLAKRRAGLPSLYGATGALTTSNAAQPMRKAKVKKTDPVSGNVTIYDVWVPEGQKVEGEIKDEAQVAPAQQDATVTRVVPPPGTVVDGVGVANGEGVVVAPAAPAESPSKRPGPPPPKRKSKSIGGKSQKRVMFAPGEGADVGEGDPMVIDDEQDEGEEEGEEGEEGIKTEEKSPAQQLPQAGEPEPTPMALDESVTPNLPPATDSNTLSLAHEPAPTAPVISPEKQASPEKSSPKEASAPQMSSDVPTIEPTTNVEQQPQSPVRPQSEQLTPPNQPSTAVSNAMDIDKEPTAVVEPTPKVETEVKAESSVTLIPPPETLVSNGPAAATTAPEPTPPSQPSASAAEQVNVVEAAQPIKEESSTIPAETEASQAQAPAVATAQEVSPQPATSEPTSQAPAVSLAESVEPPSKVESGIDKGSQPSDNNVLPPEPAPEVPEQANTGEAAPEPEPVSTPAQSEPTTVAPVELSVAPVAEPAPAVDAAVPVEPAPVSTSQSEPIADPAPVPDENKGIEASKEAETETGPQVTEAEAPSDPTANAPTD